jgi:carboxyl-terminal processing protease
MKKTLLWMALTISAAAFAAAPDTAAPLTLEPAQPQILAAGMTADLLTRYHYTPTPLDDAMSRKIFDRYLNLLDADKMLFTQADVERFSPAREQLDDAIKSRDLSTPFAIFKLYQQRQRERLVHARAQAIRATLEKRYDYALANLKKLKSEDVFQLFMNAYATSIEPHTNYLGPKATEDFDIAMRLSLVGIGAVLQERDDMTVIRELVPGGPAAQSGKLKVGDRIVGVAQASDAALTDVLGWRLDDVVRMIRGTENTAVKIDVLPADANPDAPRQLVNSRQPKSPFWK